MLQFIIKTILTILILGVVYFALARIWTHEIDIARWFKRPSETIPVKKDIEVPKLDYSITSLPSNYAEGLEIDGVKWEMDFREYILDVYNRSTASSINDLRIDMDMIGGIVNYKILAQQGCENISFSESTIGESGIVKGHVMVRTMTTYENNLKINIIKLYPESHFSLKMIVKIIKPSSTTGMFIINYAYSSIDDKVLKKKFVYKIVSKDDSGKSVYIDKNNPIEGNFRRSIMSMPAKPIVFKKNGSIEQEE